MWDRLKIELVGLDRVVQLECKLNLTYEVIRERPVQPGIQQLRSATGVRREAVC